MLSDPLPLLRLLTEQGNYPALQEACLDCDSSEPAVQILLALSRARLNDRRGAQLFLEPLNLAALDLDARVDLAAVQLALGDLDTAVATLEAAGREDGEHPLLLARLAWCRLQQGQQDIALSLYERSLARQPRMAVFHSLLRLYLDRNQNDRAATCLTQAWQFWAQEKLHWPEEQWSYHELQLELQQLCLWAAVDALPEAEAWLEGQREELDEEAWSVRVSAWSRHLAEHDYHAQAEDVLRRALAHYPRRVPLIQLLADLAEVQGRVAQAIALLQRGLRLAEQQDAPALPLLVQLATVAQQNHPKLARQMAERALQTLGGIAGESPFRPDQLEDWRTRAQIALAAVDAHEQRYERAEAGYRQALAERPQAVPAFQGLGQLCMQLGRIDEAEECFQKIKAIDPARGYAALINARRFPEDEATLEKLETLARQPSLEGRVRAGLLFQLAAAWEKLQDFKRAFALADEANAGSRKFLRYDPEAHRQRCARIRYAFNRALYDHRPDCGVDSALPVFVVGMPRSGTTLIEQILAGHSRIHGAGELGLIPRLIAGLERWERQTGSGRRYPDCIDDIDPKTTAGIAESALHELREYAPDAAHIVDKLPHNFENIGLIKFLFPKAKIISARRDPRDVAVSNYFTDYAAKHGGMGFAYGLDWIGEQLADHNLLMHHWQQVFPGEILEVRYEDMIAAPEASARRMLEYIGVDWEPQVLRFNELERPVKTASVWQVRQPIYQTSKAKWRRYEEYLAPLIAATNRKIEWKPIEMTTLPEPGWLNQGVDLFREQRLDDAERCFKQLLHFIPDHAAANFMLGFVYFLKGYIEDGIANMESALVRCPWNRDWRQDLARAYELAGKPEQAAAVRTARGYPPPESDRSHESSATTFPDPPRLPEAEAIR